MYNDPAAEALRAYPGVTEDAWAIFQRTILDQEKDYPPPEPVINLVQNGETLPFMTKKALSLWQGKEKSKKTTLLAIAVAAYITQKESVDPIRLEAGVRGKVLFFDCEQGESYAARTMNVVLKLAGLKTSPDLDYCDLRELTPAVRLDVIRAAIEGTENVRLVVIDGLVDMMNDFMDAQEAHQVVTTLLKLSSQHDTHIAVVLHQNKNDKNARAHVGTISTQKCEREIVAEVDPNDRAQSIISCRSARGFPFEDFAIRWDKGSLPCIVQDWNAAKHPAKAEKKIRLPTEYHLDTHQHMAREVFSVCAEMQWSALKRQVDACLQRSLNGPITIRMIESWIGHWLHLKILIQIGTQGTRASKYCLGAQLN